MIGAILLLGLMIFALQVLFGRRDAGTIYSFLILLIVGPILLSIGISHSVWFWEGLPVWAQVVSVILLPFLLFAILRRLLPKSPAIDAAQGAIFDTLVYAITFPFRLIWRSGRLVHDRERRRGRLNPYRPVVGGRPPLMRDREERNR